jgi:hypothetical protein
MTMTIDDRIDEKIDKEKIEERAERFLRIMDRVTPIIFEILGMEHENGVHLVEVNLFKQARYVLEAAQAIIETNIDTGGSFLERYETAFGSND